MVGNAHKKLSLLERSYSGIIKKEIKRLALIAGFTKGRLGELEVVVSEMVSNLIKHANQQGFFLVKEIEKDDIQGIEIICIDHGPGMKNPEKMIEDGISSSGSLGEGLGAIKRLSDEFGLYSLPHWGTIIISRLYTKRIKKIDKKTLTFGTINVPADGEDKCGDGYGLLEKNDLLYFIAADGLGHGDNAHKASTAAINSFLKHKKTSTDILLRNIHTDIKKTRGAVCFTGVVDVKNNVIRYTGIGNISAKRLSQHHNKNCVSYNGIVGYAMPSTLHESSLVWEENNIFVIHSDGLQTKWDLEKFPDIAKHDASMLAAALYKDYCRGHDDTLVMVLKKS